MSLKRTSFESLHYRSIRFRLAALFVGIFGITLILFSTLIYTVFINSREHEFDAALYNRALDVADGINVDFFGDLSVQSNVLFSRGKIFPFAANKAFIQIENFDGKVIAKSEALGKFILPLTLQDTALLLDHGKIFRNTSGTLVSDRAPERSQNYRIILYLISKPTIPKLILQIAVPTTTLDLDRQGLLNFFLLTIPLTLVVALLGGLYLSRRALSPVSDIIEKAQNISAMELSARVPVPEANDELKALAITLNALLDRLQQAFQSQERFIADASHQLKTPLSIMRGELDVMQSRERKPEEVSDFLTSASQEIDHLSKLVGDLLLLARVDAGHSSLSIQKVRLDEITLEEISRLEKLARTKGIKINVNLISRPQGPESNYETSGDPDLLQCMLHNLIENAIKYSFNDGRIEVTLCDSEDSVMVTVKDQGPGIPSEMLPHIFDRFYRAENTKHVASGIGLGLPIARRIAEVHGGSIGVMSQADPVLSTGTSFEVKIKKF